MRRTSSTRYDADAVLESAPEYLAHQLRQCREAPDPERCVNDERENRRSWYRKLIPWKNLYQVCKQNTLGSLLPRQVGPDSFRDGNDFVGVVVVASDTNPEQYAQDQDLPARVVYTKAQVTSQDSNETLGPAVLIVRPLLVWPTEVDHTEREVE